MQAPSLLLLCSIFLFTFSLFPTSLSVANAFSLDSHDPCSSYSSCAMCASDESHGCGFCIGSEGGKCMRGTSRGPLHGNGACSRSLDSNNWYWRTCQTKPLSCDVYTDCGTCVADPICGWCKSTNRCIDGSRDAPFTAANCPVRQYAGDTQSCSKPVTSAPSIMNDAVESVSDPSDLFPSSGTGPRSTSVINVSLASGESPTNVRVAFACIIGVTLLSVICLFYFVGLRPCLPRPGNKAHLARQSRFGTYCVTRPAQLLVFGLQFLMLIMLVVSVGLDTFSIARTMTQTAQFGATKILVTNSGGSKSQLSYGCSQDGYSAVQREQCLTAVAGAAMTLVLLLLSIIGAVVTIIFTGLGLFRANEGFHARLWSSAGVCASCCLLAVCMWASTAHIILETAFSPEETGISSLTVQLGTSWILLWPTALIFCVPIHVFMLGVVDYMPVLAGSATMMESMDSSPHFGDVRSNNDDEDEDDAGEVELADESSFGAIIPRDSRQPAYHVAGNGFVSDASVEQLH